MAQPTMSSGRITIIRGTHGVPVAVTALREDTSPSGSSSPAGPDNTGPGAAGPDTTGPDTTGKDSPGASAPSGERSGNPFAAPPKGSPDRPWQPRHPGGPGDAGHGPQDGSGRQDGSGPQGTGAPGGERWSSRQPAPHRGGSRDPFSGRPAGRPGGQQQGPGTGGPRFDVTDPVQRRARYSLMAGVAGLFFGLRGVAELALLLGALALYWGVSALRGKATPPSADSPQESARPGAGLSAWQSPRGTASPGDAPQAAAPSGVPAGPQGPQTTWGHPVPQRPYRPQFGAALCGTIAASLTLVLVAAAFTFQLVYRDYYTCMNDALTQPARQSCSQDLPAPLRQEMSSLQGD